MADPVVVLQNVTARDISLSGVTVGFTAEQVRELIEAATKGADEKLAELSRRLGVTQSAIRTMLATVGHADVPDEKLVEKLAEVIEQNRTAAAAIAALRPDNPVAQGHVADAAAAQARGDREDVRRHLRAARNASEAAAVEARRLAEQADAVAGQQMLQAARAVWAEAEQALAGLDYLEAARLFDEAAALVPTSNLDEKGVLIRRQADALQRQGDEHGDNDALRTAIQVYGRALKVLPRERVPLEWAGTQNNLGSALVVLGERENDTARLEQAVTAFREALKEKTRERVPLQWAGTQNNLGNALAILGTRESGTERLGQAVTAFREALKEWTRERVPLDWATAQHNVGNALRVLGIRECDTVRLEQAVAAYHEALKERSRERVPLDWAATQNSLGAALAVLGERESGTALLEQAVAACREALNEWTRERVPLDWATAQNSLGGALRVLGSQTTRGGTDPRAIASAPVAFCCHDGIGTPGLHCFRRSQPGLHTPLSMLRVTPRGATRMTRGRCGSLPLHRSGLSPLTSCRSPGAPWLNPPPHPITVYASHPPSPTTAQHSLPDSALPPYRGRSFTGRNASASPDAPEPEVRIHLPPAESPQTFGSACPYDALALRALLREAHLLAV